ncbi:hypothetical protein GA0070606_3932 [Micromonospora citrea]|uniref:Uncharacterized protein n=2 Tax=Micromonospora citrea TaxID=47855 RepID=A0A1C6VDA8_9ACTN|nr:hypothetical protein GA0070606_3932 [Micromonospora citrea]
MPISQVVRHDLLGAALAELDAPDRATLLTAAPALRRLADLMTRQR